MHFEVIQINIVLQKGCLNFIFSSNSNYSLRKMMFSIFSKLCWIKNESFYPVYSIMIDQFNFQESSFLKSGFYWNIFPQIKGTFPLAMWIFYWLYWFAGKIVSFSSIFMFERSLYTFVVAFVHLRSDIWEVFSILTYLLKQLLRKSSFNLMFCTLCILIQLIKSNVDPSFHMSFSILIYWIIISNF